jgi:hypothetical protein
VALPRISGDALSCPDDGGAMKDPITEEERQRIQVLAEKINEVQGTKKLKRPHHLSAAQIGLLLAYYKNPSHRNVLRQGNKTYWSLRDRKLIEPMGTLPPLRYRVTEEGLAVLRRLEAI